MKTSRSLIPVLLVVPVLALAQDAAPEGAAPDAPPPAPTRVAVAPLASLSGELKPAIVEKAVAQLEGALRTAAGLTLVANPKMPSQTPAQVALDDARRLVDEAKELRQARKFNQAEETLQKAVAKFGEGAGAITAVDELQDAYVLLAAVQYLTGKDDDGAKNLALGLALAPAREPPLVKTSALFARVVKKAAEALEKGPKGQLYVDSTPAGASVLVNGIDVGATPIRVTDLPHGKHVWRVQLPSGDAVGGFVNIDNAKEVKVAAQETGTDPESKMVAALSRNKVDKDAIEAAKAHAASMETDYLVFGALSKSGSRMALDSFILKSDSGEVKRLPRKEFDFDVDLLSAGVEFYNLAGELSEQGFAAGKPFRIGEDVSHEPKSAGVKLAVVSYAKPPDAACDPTKQICGDIGPGKGVIGQPKDDGKKTPLNKQRAPLRRQGQ